MKIIEYTTLTDSNLGSLDTRVETGIKNGWQPLGGLTIVANPQLNAPLYGQALVKYEASSVDLQELQNMVEEIKSLMCELRNKVVYET